MDFKWIGIFFAGILIFFILRKFKKSIFAWGISAFLGLGTYFLMIFALNLIGESLPINLANLASSAVLGVPGAFCVLYLKIFF